MTTRAGATAGTAPNAPLARHQRTERRPHQHAQLAAFIGPISVDGRSRRGEIWRHRDSDFRGIYTHADGRDIGLLTGMFALRSGEIAQRCFVPTNVERGCAVLYEDCKFTREKSLIKAWETYWPDIKWKFVLGYFPFRFSKLEITQLSWVLYAGLGTDERKLYFPVGLT